MKILYHHRTLSKDGQAVHIEELIAAFRRAGHEVLVVGPEHHARAAFGSGGGGMDRLRRIIPRGLGEMLEAGYSILAFFKLWRAYRRFSPDVLYERYNLYLLAGVWLRRLTGLPLLLEVNAPLAAERQENAGLSCVRFARWCERHAWRAADLVLPVTAVLGGIVVAAGVAPSKLLVVPNGIDLARFANPPGKAAVRRRLGRDGEVIIGFVGFLRAWHGLPAVIEVIAALRPHHDLRFVVIGDGPARADLERAAAARGVTDRTSVIGLVGRDDIPAHVAAFDIAIQPKATAYASPLKLFEYMAAGCAIVAPDQPNIREVLTDGVDALLFAPDDPASLRAALERLATDPPLRARLRDGARATLQRRDFTWDGNARRIMAAVGAAGVLTPPPRL